MTPDLIQRYSAGGTLLAQSIAGLSPQDLTAFPIPGTWSIQQIVLHLLDSDLVASHRMKQIIAEDNPTLVAWDESAFAERLSYNELDPHLAAELFAGNRRLTSEMLRRQAPSAFARRGIHSVRGPVTLAEHIELYTHHLDHHLKFLRRKRELLGKAL
jgi:hypothetical protein